MVTKWSDDGNTCFTLEYNIKYLFDNFKLSNIFRIETYGGKKGIDSYYEKDIYLLGFKFTKVDVNYDDIVFVELSTKNNYSSSENSHTINALKQTLVSWVKNWEYPKIKQPHFNWNYSIDGDNEYTFYITGKKKWFEDNKLGDLVTPLREITFDSKVPKYFPNYNPRLNYINKDVSKMKRGSEF